MARGPVAGQLTLDIDAPPALVNALPRVAPMSAVAGPAPFDDDEWFFEPWWPGALAIVYIEGRTHLQTEHLADGDAAFPELSGMASQFASSKVIVQGTLLVLDEDGMPDPEMLRRRLAEGRAGHGSAAFVA